MFCFVLWGFGGGGLVWLGLVWGFFGFFVCVLPFFFFFPHPSMLSLIV